MVVATLGISLPEVSQTFSLSEIEAGSLFSVIFVSASLGSAIAGRLSDKVSRKTVMVMGVSILSFGFALASLSLTYPVIGTFLAIAGIGCGFTTPSLYTLMSDLLPERRGLGASLVSVSYGIGVSAGSVIASLVIAWADWRAAFLTVGFVGLLVAGLESVAVKNFHRGQAHAKLPYRKVLNRTLLILALAEFFGGSVFWSSASWTATVLRTAKGLSLSETGWVMGLWGITPMIGALLLGPLSDRYGRRFIILRSAYPAAAAAFVVYQWLGSPAALAIGFFIFGILKASVPCLVVPLAQESTTPDAAGTAAGVVMSMHYVAAVVAPLVAAALISSTKNMILTMILTSSVPLIIYASLIAAVQEESRL